MAGQEDELQDVASDFAREPGSAPFALRVLLKVAQKSNDLARRKDGTLNRRLSDLTEFKRPATDRPSSTVCSRDVVIDAATGVWVRLFLPKTQTQAKVPVIFYFHGGGFAVLCANFFLYDIFCRKLCRTCECVVISVNYRRAPEHPYPTAYEDSFGALQWLEKTYSAGERAFFNGMDMTLDRCMLMGDSAGANIVHHIGCKWAEESSHVLKLAGHVLICPFFGGEERTAAEKRLGRGQAPLVSTDNADWYWRAFLPTGSDRNHPCCNVVGPRAPDLRSLRLPPSVVIMAEFDPLKDWQLRYVRGLRAATKPVRLLYYKSAVHSFHLFLRFTPTLSSRFFSDLQGFFSTWSMRMAA